MSEQEKIIQLHQSHTEWYEEFDKALQTMGYPYPTLMSLKYSAMKAEEWADICQTPDAIEHAEQLKFEYVHAEAVEAGPGGIH